MTVTEDQAVPVSPAVGAEHQRSADIWRTVELAASVVGPVTVLAALLYYFGWVRTAALFDYFGIDQRLLGYTTQDYLARSAGVAFRPTTALVLGALAAIVAHSQLGQLARR